MLRIGCAERPSIKRKREAASLFTGHASVLWILTVVAIAGFSPTTAAQPADSLRATYVLGADDQITVRVIDVEEFNEKPVRIDMDGTIKLPLAGRISAAGLTVEQLEAEIARSLKTYVRRPEVVVAIAEFRSQPVSVIGSVKSPGVHQLQGRKTLVEVLSLAGGLADDAGYSVRITRHLEWGPIPLANATKDASGGFSIAEIGLKGILDATKPEENILIKPNDVISVPRAEMVYVTGQVHRSGAFVLNGRQTMTVLQALSLAGGIDGASAPQHTRILRAAKGLSEREELPVDLKMIMDGKANDVPLQPDDILFIPSSLPKKAAIRAIEAAIQIGTGIAVFR
jgi:polysaccharide biosynthesis/export protein